MVTFIHGNKLARLDLKPSIILVVAIDFSVSVYVNSPDEEVEGYVGTPPRFAPEIICRWASSEIRPDPCRSLVLREVVAVYS